MSSVYRYRLFFTRSLADLWSVDSAIFTALWNWAKRRHPKKSRWWIAERYFHPVGMRRWTFSGEVGEPNGARKKVWLFRASRIPIIRHVKIRGEANPYDPAWEIYFEERLGVMMLPENWTGN